MRRWLIPLLLVACLLAGTTTASATVTREGYEAAVVLTSDSDPDTIALTCAGGEAPNGGATKIPCANVQTLIVDGGAGEDTINLGNVDTAEFPALRFVEIHVGEDFEKDVVNGTKLGDEVDADNYDSVNGGLGNDILDEGDEVSGGEGDDLMTHTTGPGNGGPGDDRFQNAAGVGPFNGGTGIDTYAIDLPSGAAVNVGFEVENGGLGITTTAESGFFFWGSIDHVQLLLTDSGTQAVDGSLFSGTLDVNGRGGPDTIVGGPGEDFLFGGAGSDDLTGNGGFDWVDGGEGGDQLFLRDGEADRGICGGGGDHAVADLTDLLASGCEQVDLPAVVPPTTAPVTASTSQDKPETDEPPETQGLKGPKKVVQGKVASFKFSSSEQGSTFKCRIDKGPLKTCTSPYKASTTKLAPDKSHTFSVFATDAAGNADKTPATLKFKVEPKPAKH